MSYMKVPPKLMRASLDSTTLNVARAKVINLYRAWYREVC